MAIPGQDKALLWAYQLKRENKHLSERLDTIDTTTREEHVETDKSLQQQQKTNRAGLAELTKKLTTLDSRHQETLDSFQQSHRTQIQTQEITSAKVVAMADTINALRSSQNEALQKIRDAQDRENDLLGQLAGLETSLKEYKTSFEDLHLAVQEQEASWEARLTKLEADIGRGRMVDAKDPAQRASRNEYQIPSCSSPTDNPSPVVISQPPDTNIFSKSISRPIKPQKSSDLPGDRSQRVPKAGPEIRQSTPLTYAPRRSKRLVHTGGGWITRDVDLNDDTEQSPTRRFSGVDTKRSLLDTIMPRPGQMSPEPPTVVTQAAKKRPNDVQSTGDHPRTRRKINLEVPTRYSKPGIPDRRPLSPVKSTNAKLNKAARKLGAGSRADHETEKPVLVIGQPIDAQNPARRKARRQIPTLA